MRAFFIICLLLASQLHGNFVFTQTIIPAGNVAGSWTSDDSPYLIQGDIVVQVDTQLLISSGTEILFMGPYQLRVHGHLNASGSIQDSIYFSCPDSINAWLGFRFIDIVQILPDSLRLSYCKITKAIKDHPDSLGGAVFARNSPRIAIDHCLFTQCKSGSGGAVYLSHSALLIRNSVFRQNEAARGGALYLHNSAADLINIEVSGNLGQVGGGIYFYSSNAHLSHSLIANNVSIGGGGGIILHKTSNVSMEHCIIEYNIANGSGGGLALLEGSMPYIQFCTIRYNQTLFDQYLAKGGGIFITQHENFPLIENCEISYNISADDGGGIYTQSGLSLISSLLIHNQANTEMGFGGGGLFALFSGCLILNSTFSDNTAQEGTALYSTGADFDLYNSIIWDDEPGEEKTIFMQNFLIDPTLKIDYTDFQGGEDQVGGIGAYNLIWGEHNMNINPAFVDFSADNYALSDSSPCINAGLLDTLAFLLPSLDIAMNPRLAGITIDLGAYENQTPLGLGPISKDPPAILNIYPVPARDHLNIRLSEQLMAKPLLVLIINASGQVLISKSHTVSSNNILIDLQNVSSGLYVLMIMGDHISASARFNVIK
ncbi:MAG: right-handed parallel beta-helix repeat-containing protein [Bacteroidota bacterium]|nr:right-handed parallel beta-helix repeat-containing protein [Bacteroidota bacterium]